MPLEGWIIMNSKIKKMCESIQLLFDVFMNGVVIDEMKKYNGDITPSSAKFISEVNNSWAKEFNPYGCNLELTTPEFYLSKIQPSDEQDRWLIRKAVENLDWEENGYRVDDEDDFNEFED
jgi:hypothetical protein